MVRRNCLLCYHVYDSKGFKIPKNKLIGKSRINSILDEQVAVIFILRTLLDIPGLFCEGLLSQNGHPSTWISCCKSCSELISDAHEIFKKITHLKNLFERMKSQIRKVLDTSKDVQISVFSHAKSTNEIRKFLLGESISPQLNPVDLDESDIKPECDFFVESVEDDEIDSNFPHFNDDDKNIDEKDEEIVVDKSVEAHSVQHHCVEASQSQRPQNKMTVGAESAEDEDDGSDWNCEDGNSEDLSSDFLEAEEKMEEKWKTKGQRETVGRNPIGKESTEDKEELPFKCEKCEGKFLLWKLRRRHYIEAHPEFPSLAAAPRPYNVACEYCGKKVVIGFIIHHIKICRKEKPTVSPIWGEDVRDVNPQLPEGEKEIAGVASDFCDKESGSEEQIKMSVGSADCWENDFGQSQKSQEESWDFPFKCEVEVCGRKFALWKDLKKHYVDAHYAQFPSLASAPRPEKLVCEMCGQSVATNSIKGHYRSCVREKSKTTRENVCNICDKKFRCPLALTIHRRGVHYKELDLEPFECKECKTVYKNREGLKLHVLNIHQKAVSVFCSVCNAGFFSKGYLNTHMVKVHGSDKFSCPQCSKTFPSANSLKEHVIAHHTKDFPFFCHICGKGAVNESRLKRHMRGHSDRNKFPCDICGAAFKDESYVKKHQLVQHYKELKLTPLLCDLCGRACATQTEMNVHMRSHTKDYPFSCPHCDKKCPSNADLKLHIRQHHTGETPFPCPSCAASFFSKQYLKDHEEKKHTGLKWKCEVCKKMFIRKSRLNYHKKTHGPKVESEKKFTCEICGAAYSRALTLKYHQRGKHFEQLKLTTFPCESCGKTFGAKCEVNAHIALYHRKEYKFSCQHCGQNCWTKHILDNHVRVRHTGEKPFDCKTCGEAFSIRAQLKCHEQKHTGFKFKCQICDKVFLDRSRLNKHLKIHKRKGEESLPRNRNRKRTETKRKRQ